MSFIELSSLFFHSFFFSVENRMTTVFSSDSFFIFFFIISANGLVTQLCIHCSSSFALSLVCLSADLCLSPLRNTVRPRKALFLRVQSFWGSGLYQTPFLSPSSFSLFSRLLILNIYICLLLFLPSLVDSHKTHLLSFPVRSHRFLPSDLSG